MRVVGVVCLIAILIVGGLWCLVVLAAQAVCSIVPLIPPQCQNSDLDVWSLPFLTAPIGLPSFAVSVVVFVIAVIRKGRSQAAKR
jgi:hypothetical protein